ncbi:hypothetical protein SanaruYs_38570 [Chryseotalea sanaruensis]|uniref:Uncharacterized protein n=1 Tax=Chryseotalea sanaruensis TaxID=2482724 RepID=A0A401UFG8_9BACT|nr:hypothetical protein [Chryseotalea sanaruensis]GCC53612.1 hypothetical protein SanaruYs_38570 [Chryseotalea sanaruensis]
MKLIKGYAFAMLATFTLISCEDEVPKIGFSSNSSEVIEGSTVSVPLSVAIPSGVSPIINFTGTATEGVDFEWAVSADGKELVFETFPDDFFDEETIIIEITGFSGSANVGATVTHTINISDPGMLVELTWIGQDGLSADLDIVIFKENSPGSGEYSEVFSSEDSGPNETTVLRGDYTNANYAIAINYFGGLSNEVDFTLNLSTSVGTINGNDNEISFNGTLTQYHIDEDSELTYVTLAKNNFNYSNFSNLIIDLPLEIILSWNAGNGTAGDVDMDLTLFYLNPDTEQFEVIDGSYFGDSPTETVSLPLNEPNGTYGLRYEYFSGSSNTLSFTATFSLNGIGNFSGTTNSVISFNGAYTLSNISGSDTNISQTFVKSGNTFSNFSAVSIPVSGSGAQLEDSFLKKKNKARFAGRSNKKEKGAARAILNLNK